MNSKVLYTLVEQGVVTSDTKVRAYIPSLTFNGTRQDILKDVKWKPSIGADRIVEIEGMDPIRFASSYDIKSDGTKKVYKKRGRKPKVVT